MVSPVPPTTTSTKKSIEKKKSKAAKSEPKDDDIKNNKKTNKNDPPTTTNDDGTSSSDANNEMSAEDIAFEKLLNSQRELLAKMDFGNASNSSGELQFVEGPDNLPLVSPHSSASEFHLSYEFEYDYHCQQQQQQDQYEFEQQQAYQRQRHQRAGGFRQGYPFHSYPSQQRYHHNQYDYGADAPPSSSSFPRDSTHSVGVGDDRFILDEIQIGPGAKEGSTAVGVFDDTAFDTSIVRRRKRETEQELMDTIHRRERKPNKKRRSGGSTHNVNRTSATAYDDLLPVPSDLTDLDGGDDNDNVSIASSLHLDDLDFPSMHNETTTTTTTNNSRDEETKATAVTSAVVKPVVSMDGDELSSATSTTTGTTSRRSSRNLWKPRQRSSTTTPVAALSIQEQRSMWKPRKSSTTTKQMNDSCASLQVDDLATASASTQENKKNHVSLQDEDLMPQQQVAEV